MNWMLGFWKRCYRKRCWKIVSKPFNNKEGPYKGRYLYWFHNHGGKSYQGRNPVYLLGGIEKDGPEGRVIHWGDPVAILYDEDPKLRMSYPDFIWDDGSLHITETQKHVARVHRIPDELLAKLWAVE